MIFFYNYDVNVKSFMFDNLFEVNLAQNL